MRINPQSFFNFCANHSALLSALAAHGEEFSEAEAMRLIRANPCIGEELPETAWRRLRELQILISTERSEERRVGKECRSLWWTNHEDKENEHEESDSENWTRRK